MLYMPAIYNEWEWQRVDRLLLSDPVLYAWMHWEVENIRKRLRWPGFSFRRTSEPIFADSIYRRLDYGFNTSNRRDDSPYQVPPH